MKNIGLLFTKEYFKPTTDDKKYKIEENEGDLKLLYNKSKLEERSEEITNEAFDKSAVPEMEDVLSFYLKTLYPGLLIGSGYMHDIKNEGAFKLGFYFDYTTGLPVIPGSSIKGVLRDAFEKAGGEYVKELIKELPQTENIDLDINLLIDDIFEGKQQGNSKSIYDRDIFFDAFPVATANKNGKFLANDYITPHKEPLKNPVPLQFLKVLPGVTFRFNFKLHDTKEANEKVLLSKDIKLELFKRILLDLGIGAKTNVGYGQFVDIMEEKKRKSNIVKNSHHEAISQKSIDKIKRGDIVQAKVIKKEGKSHTLKLFIKGYEKEAFLSYYAGIDVGKIISVKISGIQGKGTNKTLQVILHKL